MIKAIMTVKITVDNNTEIVITKNVETESTKLNLRKTADSILRDLVGKIRENPVSVAPDSLG